MLYQLSYTPKQQILSFIELPYEHRDTALETTALPTELYPYMQFSISQYHIIHSCRRFVKRQSEEYLFYKGKRHKNLKEKHKKTKKELDNIVWLML